MNLIKLMTLLSFYAISTLSQAEWISEVDKKYQQRFPTEYAKIIKAKNLISNANGNTSQTYEAIELLDAITKKDPMFAPAYLQLARAMSNLGMLPGNKFDPDLLKAKEKLTLKALEIEPEYDYAIALMGYTKMFQGKLDEAEKYYKQALIMGSSYPYLKSQLAQLAIKRGDYELALKLALQAYEQNKATPSIAASSITEIIFAYQNLPGDTAAEEEKWYAKRCELEPSAWNWDAYASFKLYRLGDYEKSIEYGEKALSIMNFGVGRYNLAAAYYVKWSDLKDRSGKLDLANKAFKTANSIYPPTRKMAIDFMRYPKLKPAGESLLKRAPPTDQ